MCAMLCAYMCARIGAGCRGHFGLKAPPSSPFVLFPTLPTQEGGGERLPRAVQDRTVQPSIGHVAPRLLFYLLWGHRPVGAAVSLPPCLAWGTSPAAPRPVATWGWSQYSGCAGGCSRPHVFRAFASAYSRANAAHGVALTHTCDSMKSPHSVSWPDYLCP